MTLAQRSRGAATALRVLAGGRLGTAGGVVLAYHDVVDGAAAPVDFSVTSARLRSHVRWARSFGLRFVDLDALFETFLGGGAIDGLAAICFDDGLAGVHRRALPVLADLDVRATAFVVSRDPGSPASWWPDAGRTMTRAELAELVAAGWRIGSHTRTHRMLPGLADRELEAEVRGSRADLEDLTGVAVDLFAYPGGRHDVASRRAVESAGYRAAFGFVNGRIEGGSARLALPRLCMDGQARPRFAYHLARPASSWPPDPYLAPAAA